MVVGSFIGAVLANLVINPVLYLHTDVLSRWAPGMTAIPASISNRFDFWLSFGIGTSFVIAFTGFYMVGKTPVGTAQDSAGNGASFGENQYGGFA